MWVSHSFTNKPVSLVFDLCDFRCEFPLSFNQTSFDSKPFEPPMCGICAVLNVSAGAEKIQAKALAKASR